MHGVIFMELRKYVDTKLGRDVWDDLLKEAGLGGKLYLATWSYPDEEAVAIVTAIAKRRGQSIPAILEDFGEFIAPTLLHMYRALIPSEWRTLDVIENTEHVIHRVVRIRQPGATPPQLVAHRSSPKEVVITYTSRRKMCGLAKGIAKGIARQYNEPITITELSCMLRGDSACVISVKAL